MKVLTPSGGSLIIVTPSFKHPVCSGRLFVSAWDEIVLRAYGDATYGAAVTFTLKSGQSYRYSFEHLDVDAASALITALIRPSANCSDYSQGGEFFNRFVRAKCTGKFPI